ncbi:hypothetical protein F4804DRAFT_175101 [Jackrogersella minutella]|nr:hypothetical protein F4804DRAFT_175101 [Jackrogersella minutella]
MQALTTVFTAPSWCVSRFAVAIDNNPFHSSTSSPSRGWADPSFSQCIPSQYTDNLQTMSPGVCPGYMTIARTTSNVDGGKTLWTGGCCQSGFSDMSGYYCTSTVTTPMAFLLLPNITTTDIYTTLSNMWIEHDQMAVAWQETDLKILPEEIVTRYASIMGITLTTTTFESPATTHTASAATEGTSSTIATTTPTDTVVVIPVTDSPTGLTTGTAETLTASSTTSSDAGHQGSRWIVAPLITCLVVLWILY